MSTENFKIDLSYLSEIAGDNKEFIVEMIDVFLMQTPNQVEDLAQSIKAKDWKKIADTSHKIKPTLAFMGLNDAKEKMQQIELDARREQNFEVIENEFANLNLLFPLVYSALEEHKIVLSS